MNYCIEHGYIAHALFGLLTVCLPTMTNWMFEDMTWQMLIRCWGTGSHKCILRYLQN